MLVATFEEIRGGVRFQRDDDCRRSGGSIVVVVVAVAVALLLNNTKEGIIFKIVFF